MHKILFFFLLIASYFSANAQDTIRMADFGYVPGTHADAVIFVQKAIALCRSKKKPVLIFEKGRYDFWPEHADEKFYYESNTDVISIRKCAVLIEDFKNLTIDFNGSDLIFHGRVQPITIDSSKNITIKNVTIDWEVPMTAQGQITKVENDYIEIQINPESPCEIRNKKIFFIGEGWVSELSDIMEFEKESKRIAQGCGDGCLGNDFYLYTAEEISKSLVRIHYTITRPPAVGNYLALRHSARDHAGTFITNSKNVTIENLNMFQNAGLGILSQYSDNLSFKNVQCVPNPLKNRVFAGHDDGLHFSNCKGQITVDSSRFLGLMDDPINVHGTSVQIIEKLSNRKLLCKFMHHQSIGFVWARPGEKIGFIENEAMNTLGNGMVETFAAKNSTEFEITFTAPIPAWVTTGDALENLIWVPDVLIQNSFFGSSRARGILVTTPGKVIIQNNIFESSGSAILISGDANGWYESGAVSDVLISNNNFKEPCLTSIFQFCEGIISINPVIPKTDVNKPFHRNIRIVNNKFNPYDYPVLYANSTEGLIFSNNIINRSVQYKPMHPRKFMITLDGCKKIEVKGNKFIGDVLGRNINLISTLGKELKLGKKQGIAIEKK